MKIQLQIKYNFFSPKLLKILKIKLIENIKIGIEE